MGLNLHLVHLVCVGEHKLQHQVSETSLESDIAMGLCTVALDVGHDVMDFDVSVIYLTDVGIHMTDGQLAAFLLTDLGRALLGDIDVEGG